MPSIHLKYLSILLSCHEFIYKFSCLSILSVCLSVWLSIYRNLLPPINSSPEIHTDSHKNAQNKLPVPLLHHMYTNNKTTQACDKYAPIQVSQRRLNFFRSSQASMASTEVPKIRTPHLLKVVGITWDMVENGKGFTFFTTFQPFVL